MPSEFESNQKELKRSQTICLTLQIQEFKCFHKKANSTVQVYVETCYDCQKSWWAEHFFKKFKQAMFAIIDQATKCNINGVLLFPAFFM